MLLLVFCRHNHFGTQVFIKGKKTPELQLFIDSILQPKQRQVRGLTKLVSCSTSCSVSCSVSCSTSCCRCTQQYQAWGERATIRQQCMYQDVAAARVMYLTPRFGHTLYSAMPCHAMLCYAMLCCAMLSIYRAVDEFAISKCQVVTPL